MFFITGDSDIWFRQPVLRREERAPWSDQRQVEAEDLVDVVERDVRAQVRLRHDEERLPHSLQIPDPPRRCKIFKLKGFDNNPHVGDN